MAKVQRLTQLLPLLQHDYPAVRFIAGDVFCWSPATNQVMYRRPRAAKKPARSGRLAVDKPNSSQDPNPDGVEACYSLLHELGHALLEHQRYQLDIELLQLEVAAWEHAKVLARNYGLAIDDDHIQNCLDTYRDWLYRRSICPSCTTKALQLDDQPEYRCFNCHATWRVSPSRFCRPYRKSAGQQPVAVFAAEL